MTFTDEDLKRMGRGERWGMPADGHDYIAQMATELLTARAALAVAVEALRLVPHRSDPNAHARDALAKLDAMGQCAAQGKADAAESGTGFAEFAVSRWWPAKKDDSAR